MDDFKEKFLQFIDLYEEHIEDNGTIRRINAYKTQLDNIVLENKRELYIDFDHLYEYDSELAKFLLNNPDSAIEECVDVFKSKLLNQNGDNRYYVRFYSTKTLQFKKISQLRDRDVDHLVYVKGVVSKEGKIKQYVTDAVFECKECGNLMNIIQDCDILLYPSKCNNPNCENKAKNRFKYRTLDSKRIDYQLIKIQEQHSDLENPNDLPYLIPIKLWDSTLVGRVKGGDHVKLVGIFRSEPERNEKGMESCVLINYIHAINIEREFIEEVEEITDEDIKLFHEVAKEEGIQHKIARSIAPNIIGHFEMKLASALALFGGTKRPGMRNISHVLFMGDPSTGKSQVIKKACELALRHVYTTGQGVTSAGLTGAALNDKSMGGFYLEAGAIPRASGGVAAIDEFDKMNETDRRAMHEVMEQLSFSIAKAGIVATLQCETTLICGANPKDGRYDLYKTPRENINLPPAIISRFDLIFIILDKCELETDKKISTQILCNYVGILNKDLEEQDFFEPEFLRKYIMYAKNTYFPKISEKFIDKIKNFYVEARQFDKGFMLPRNLEGVVRLSEASAKMCLRNEVIESDIDLALGLVKKSLFDLGYDYNTNTIDMDRLLTGKSKEEREKSNNFYSQIKELVVKKFSLTKSPYFLRDEIATVFNLDSNKTQDILNKLIAERWIRADKSNGATKYTTEAEIWK